jgi:hypothetical protein
MSSVDDLSKGQWGVIGTILTFFMLTLRDVFTPKKVKDNNSVVEILHIVRAENSDGGKKIYNKESVETTIKDTNQRVHDMQKDIEAIKQHIKG